MGAEDAGVFSGHGAFIGTLWTNPDFASRGCAIGTRPIDQHLKGFEALGAEISLGQGYIEAKSNGRLRGAKVYLDVASVGATENIMMVATLAEGITVIENAAKEPEIVDLANYLNAMGAKVRGAGTGVIRIEGVEQMHGVKHNVIPDRIEAGTFMVAARSRAGMYMWKEPLRTTLDRLFPKWKRWGLPLNRTRMGFALSLTNH